jgi:transcription antitermination protein NusB
MHKKRHLLRQELMEILYQHRLLNRDVFLISEHYEFDVHDADAQFILKLLEFIHINEEVLIEKLSSYLKDWEFERIPCVDQAILLIASAELERALEDRAVIIDEAVLLAKTFSDDEAYKYINAILDAYE